MSENLMVVCDAAKPYSEPRICSLASFTNPIFGLAKQFVDRDFEPKRIPIVALQRQQTGDTARRHVMKRLGFRNSWRQK